MSKHISSNKFVFISNTMPDYSPYLQYYFNVFENNNVEYEVICRNRTGEKIIKDNRLIVYNVPIRDDASIIKKFIDFLGFYRFVINQLKRKKYKGVIIFNITTAIFFCRFLSKKYKHNYIFDIRDYYSIYRYLIIRKITHRLLKNSAINCISSNGFREWLPNDVEYIISHNININTIHETSANFRKHENPVSIITIGIIRDYSSNLDIIKSLANDEKFKLTFVGYSIITPKLEEYVNRSNISNVVFQGKYLKENELNIIAKHDMMNIYLPNNILSNHLLTNRFYLSVLMKKPMIVNDGSYQAEQVSKYGLGIVLKKSDNFSISIKNYWDSLNAEEYERNCKQFIDSIVLDIKMFDEIVTSFVKGSLLTV